MLPISDLNECTLGSYTCDSNAECHNTVGSYTCSCRNGFTGNGKTCIGEKLTLLSSVSFLQCLC